MTMTPCGLCRRVVHSKEFTCYEDTPLSMGKVNTSHPGCDHPDAPTSDPSNKISYEISGLKAGTKYYWKVVAKDGNGDLTESQVWSFVTK